MSSPSSSQSSLGPPRYTSPNRSGQQREQLVEPDRAGLEGLLAAGVRPHVDATFPLEQAGQAHELGQEGRTRGKIVLTV